MDYELSEKYRMMSDDVINAVPELKWIRDTGVKISYERSFKEKKKAHKYVYGECRKVPDEWALYCPYDFRIIIYENNIAYLSENQIKILLWHEHLHIGLNEKDGQLKYIVVPHDVEEFSSIIGVAGIGWDMPGRDIPDITQGGG